MTAAFLTAAVLTAEGAAGQPAGAAPRALTVDDLLAIETLSDPQISPEGDWIAYTVERNVIDDDEVRSQIFMVSRDGAETVELTSADESASTPRWSPDGRYLAFLAAKDGAETQAWTLDRRGGEAQPYTDVEQGVQDFAWSPDGQRMLLAIEDKTAADLEREAAEQEGREARPLPYVVDRLEFKSDGETYLDRSRTHIYVADGREAAPRQLTFGDFDDGEAVWSPDGESIAFVSNRTDEPDANDNTDIWVVSAASDAEASPLTRITNNPGPDYAPAFSHDGRRVVYVTVTEPALIWYATNHLAMASARGGDERVLTAALDRNVAAPRFTPDDESIVFLLEDSAEVELARFDLRANEVRRAHEPGTMIEAFAQHDETGDLVALIGVPERPSELFALAAAPRASDQGRRQLTHTNAARLADVELARVENVSFASTNGAEIEGFVFMPPGYERGTRYPTILWIHGGPVWRWDFSFNPEAQWLAANGFVVIAANPRGSSGYGQPFSLEIFADWGVKDFEDVMAAVDYAVAEGYSDPDRLGVGGWSYGGILTNYVITKSERFAAAITGASEVNYAANYGHDHYQHEWETELGLPWESREAWDRISPWNDVGDIVTPTLVMGGKEDWNVPIQNSEQLYQALRRRGVPTELVVYPDESHSITRPSFVRDRLERYARWYGEHVRAR